MKPSIGLLTAILFAALMASTPPAAAALPSGWDLFRGDNLVAWCIVPFDAKQRGPAERADMLRRLGIKKVAYDWRAPHVPTFEEEILQYKKHDLEFFAFWGWHDDFGRLIAKHKIRPQIWKTLGAGRGETQAERVESAAREVLPLVEKTRSLNCRLGLYNHGGWGGEPENLVAVVKWLRAHSNADHVGIVYNLHHGHGHIADLEQVLARMKPYLLCLNLNGMNDNAQPKILPIGSGRHDRALLETIARSGYTGPIGILDHRSELDAEQSLQQNLDGLRKTIKELRKQ